jgi:hypothetical protein
MSQLSALLQPALRINTLQVSPNMPPTGHGAPETVVGTLVALPGGLMAALARLLGLGKTITLTVSNHRIIRTDQGPGTKDTAILPLKSTSMVHYGFRKPSVALVIIGGLFTLLGLVMMLTVRGGAPGGMMQLIIGGSLLAVFFSGRNYYLSFSNAGGHGIALKVKTQEAGDLDRLCELAAELARMSDVSSRPPVPSAAIAR